MQSLPKPKYRVNYQLSRKRAAPSGANKAESKLESFGAFVESIDYDYENINNIKMKPRGDTDLAP